MSGVAACALAIVLATDISGSVNQERFDLQRYGMAAAFRSPEVVELITSSDGGVAFNLVQFASQSIEDEWVVLRTSRDIEAYATRIETKPRAPFTGMYAGTGIFETVRFSLKLMESQPCLEPRRMVIDVAADGQDSEADEETAEMVRSQAAESGIQINALAILGAEGGHTARLTEHMRDEVISSDGFVMEANSHADIERVFRRKLAREMAMNLGGQPYY